MASVSDLQKLSLADVSRQCAEESERFFRRLTNDARFCFELFRRAMVEHNARAWDLVYAQYSALVGGWVHRHPAFASAGEEADYFLNRAFEKLHLALTPEKFNRLPDLKAVLRYLQMCVHSALVDHARRLGPASHETPLDELESASQPQASPVEALVLNANGRQALWDWLAPRLHTEQERQVIYGCFVLDLKPREIHQTFKGVFSSVGEVYRVKQNLLERLRRDPESAQFLEDA